MRPSANGVTKTSRKPSAATPTTTTLPRKVSGGTSGATLFERLLLRVEEAVEAVVRERRRAIAAGASDRATAAARGTRAMPARSSRAPARSPAARAVAPIASTPPATPTASGAIPSAIIIAARGSDGTTRSVSGWRIGRPPTPGSRLPPPSRLRRTSLPRSRPARTARRAAADRPASYTTSECPMARAARASAGKGGVICGRRSTHAIHRERLIQRRASSSSRAPTARVGSTRLRARRLGHVDDIAGPLGGLHQRLVRLLARPLGLAHHELRPIGLGEQHVVEHGLGAACRQVVDERGVHQPRPGPAADQRLHPLDAVIVDVDEDDVGTRRRRRGWRPTSGCASRRASSRPCWPGR